MSKYQCVVCGRPESEHHTFIPYQMPEGCVCDPGEWGNRVLSICERYEVDEDSLCSNCEHLKECHKGG